jgi:hypothetical protein
MTRLNPQDITTGEPLDLGAVTLTIHHDNSGFNPWTDWDCQTPLAVYQHQTHAWGRVETWDSGDGILDPLGDVSPRWASRHWRAICGVLDLDPQAHDLEARAQARDYGEPLGAVRLERFRDALGDMAGDTWGVVCDYFDALAALWELRGCPALAFQRNGYSQGDSVLGLLVATPAHAKRRGFDLKAPGRDIRASLESDADLFGAWAFGDVYGFVLKDTATGETVDSCWGFYGSPWGCNPEKGNAWAVLDEALDALKGEAPARAEAAHAEAEAARAAFLEGKAEARKAHAQGVQGPRLCAMVRAALKAQAEAWRDAARRARAWATLSASLEG